jgi:hypothetical protein
MSKKINHFTSAYKAAFPEFQNSKGHIYLTQNLLRKAIEQASWLITQKEKDSAQLVSDATVIAGADQAPAEGTLAICAKYGAVRGAMHYDDIALDRIDERLANIEVEIDMLQGFVEQSKTAYQDCTGDAYTERAAAPKSAISEKRKAELRAKYAA